MYRIFALTLVILVSACANEVEKGLGSQPALSSLVVAFDEVSSEALGDSASRIIRQMISDSEIEVRALLPSLPDSILVNIEVVDRDIDVVGGVSGRVEAPGKVTIQLSSTYPGGILAAAETALSSTIFHEFHHLFRGWTIQDNRFGQGIPIAAVNEGLASVFSETYTGVYFKAAYSCPEDVADWLAEIQALPTDANYQIWMMGKHPDGRNSIGYRVGRFIIHRAAKQSGKGIIELACSHPTRYWQWPKKTEFTTAQILL